jgi:amphi-Trp domain-containing protein
VATWPLESTASERETARTTVLRGLRWFIFSPPVEENMPEEVLFESESTQDRAQIASFLRTVADNLDAGDSITLSAGEESLTMDPPSRPTFEVKAEREGAADGPKELSIEFELEWDENAGDEAGGSGQLQIE